MEIDELKAKYESSMEQRCSAGTAESYSQEQWKKVSRPRWRRILAQAEEDGDDKRMRFAEYMLREVLK